MFALSQNWQKIDMRVPQTDQHSTILRSPFSQQTSKDYVIGVVTVLVVLARLFTVKFGTSRGLQSLPCYIPAVQCKPWQDLSGS